MDSCLRRNFSEFAPSPRNPRAGGGGNDDKGRYQKLLHRRLIALVMEWIPAFAGISRVLPANITKPPRRRGSIGLRRAGTGFPPKPVPAQAGAGMAIESVVGKDCCESSLHCGCVGLLPAQEFRESCRQTSRNPRAGGGPWARGSGPRIRSRGFASNNKARPPPCGPRRQVFTCGTSRRAASCWCTRSAPSCSCTSPESRRSG